MCCSSIGPWKRSHKIIYHPKKQLQFSQTTIEQNCPKTTFSKCRYGIYFMEFSTNWLSDALSITWQWLKLQTWFFAVWCYFSLKSAFCLLRYVQCILHELTSLSVFSHSSLLTVSICMWWLPFVMEIVCTCCFYCKGAFETVVDSYCCVMGWTWLKTKCNGYFTFQIIIDITEAHDAISFF